MPNWTTFESFLEEAQSAPLENRQSVVGQLLRERPAFPWIEGNSATFVYVAIEPVQNVAVNLDTLPGDPPFAPMENLEGTSFWYVTLNFEDDDLLDYMLAINDPMTPIAKETDIVGRINRYWRADPQNPIKMSTAQMNVSVLQMENARPFPDWTKMGRVERGEVFEHHFSSMQLRVQGRKLWVYTPPEYEGSGKVYPLLILQDGQWCAGPLQVPFIADALIKHRRMQPVVIAMLQSGDQRDRIKNYVSNDHYFAALQEELIPFIKTRYRIDSTNIGIGGVGPGAIAAAHASLKNPAVFSHLIMISPPLGRGPAQDQLKEYVGRFQRASLLPRRIFQSVGRYEARARFYLPGQLLNSILSQRGDIAYQYVEIGSGHGLVGFRSVLPEALSWAFPG